MGKEQPKTSLQRTRANYWIKYRLFDEQEQIRHLLKKYNKKMHGIYGFAKLVKKREKFIRKYSKKYEVKEGKIKFLLEIYL